MKSQPITEFQRAIVENYREGRCAHLAGAADQKKLMTALRKDPAAAPLAKLIEQTAGLDDVSDVGAVLMSSELGVGGTDLTDAMAAVGAVAMVRHGPGR